MALAPGRYSVPMPAGKVHLAVELGTLPLWVAGGVALGVERSILTAFVASYLGASLLLSPDLDLWGAAPSRRWGPLRVLWVPYAFLFRHRGISHSLFLGPLTRLAYLGAWVALGWAALHFTAGVPGPRRPPWELAPPILAGVYLPHLLHVGLDRASKGRWMARAGIRRL